MLEREALTFILDIHIAEGQYFCDITNRDKDVTYTLRPSKFVRNFVKQIGGTLFHGEQLYPGRHLLEERFVRERVSACLADKLDCDYFYASDKAGKPVGVGIFIAWEDETHGS